MARFRVYSYEQAVMLPVALGRQLQPEALSALSIIWSTIESTGMMRPGTPAIDPAVVLKFVLCPDTRPRSTTIAGFIYSMEGIIVGLFPDEEGARV